MLPLNEENMKENWNIIRDKLQERFIRKWRISISAPKKNGSEPKLRTYAKFKREIELENYLKIIKDPDRRSALTKFRISAHNLKIETLRYAKQNRQRIPPEERKCTLCNIDKVDDELHTIVECTASADDRRDLQDKCPRLADEDNLDFFIRIMKSSDEATLLSLTNLIINALELRKQEYKNSKKSNNQPMTVTQNTWFNYYVLCMYNVYLI